MKPALTMRVSLCAALLLLPSVPVRAQATDTVLRPWNCLMSSAPSGGLFGNTPPLPGCAVPAVIWSRSSLVQGGNLPSQPSALSSTVVDHTLRLTWSAPRTGAPASYRVQVGTASGSANVLDASTDSPLPTLTISDAPGGTYFVRVLAQTADGTSLPSNEIAVAVGSGNGLRASGFGRAAVCTAPPASTAFTAIQDGNISVTFAWRAGEGECQAFALPTGYILEYGFAPGQTAGSLSLPAQPTTVTVSLVGVGTGTYYTRVRGVNAQGVGQPSNEAIVRVGGVCAGAPVAPTAMSGTAAGSTVVLTWGEVSPSQNTPTSYRVIAGLQPGGNVAQFGSSGNVFRITSVPAGSYYFRAVGVNSCGVSAESNEVLVGVGGSAVPTVVTGVHQFAGAPSDGANFSTLVLGRDGNFYGTSASGGAINPRCVANLEGCGVIFRMTPAGALTLLYAFGGSSPVYPYGRLFQAADGNFWGTTTGQEDGRGAASLFKMTPAGAVTFVAELGGPSYATLTQAADGTLFGTTTDNGPGPCSWRSTSCLPTSGAGTVFRVNADGSGLTYVHTFSGADGSKAYGGLMQASDGFLYGTTSAGGAANLGTIYRMKTDGSGFTTLYSFRGGADGANPAYSTIMRASDGNFYGTTQFGGGPVNSGTVFKMTPAGAVTILHAFTGVLVRTGEALPTTATDGLQPGASVIEAGDGRLYGVTGGGGAYAGGTAFSIAKDGSGYAQLYSFDGTAPGGSPTATLVGGPDGLLWGTAQYGGSSNRGTIFKMTVPR